MFARYCARARALVSSDRGRLVGKREDQRDQLSLQPALRKLRQLVGDEEIDPARNIHIAYPRKVFRIRGVLKEGLHLDAQNPGDVMQPAGTDPVGPLLVFLQLLKCQPELQRDSGLGEPPADAHYPDTATDQPIYRVDVFRRLPRLCDSTHCFYIPGIGMISTISIHAPGMCKWGWSLPKIFVAASCDSACTTE